MTRTLRRALARALVAQGVPVATRFSPVDHAAALPHEYQFNLDTPEGREALERTIRFRSPLPSVP